MVSRLIPKHYCRLLFYPSVEHKAVVPATAILLLTILCLWVILPSLTITLSKYCLVAVAYASTRVLKFRNFKYLAGYGDYAEFFCQDFSQDAWYFLVIIIEGIILRRG